MLAYENKNTTKYLKTMGSDIGYCGLASNVVFSLTIFSFRNKSPKDIPKIEEKPHICYTIFRTQCSFSNMLLLVKSANASVPAGYSGFIRIVVNS